LTTSVKVPSAFVARLLLKRQEQERQLTPLDIGELGKLFEWAIVDGVLTKRYEFLNRRQCAAFVAALCVDANTSNHHPDVVMDDNGVTVRYCTHQVGDEVTEIDYAAAARAEVLATTYDRVRYVIDGGGAAVRFLGGKGSGNYGHGGRPGHIGGSSEGIARDSVEQKLRQAMRETKDFNSTKFILSDGTQLSHSADTHDKAAKAAGVDLYGEALQHGVIRYTVGHSDGPAAEVGSPITATQASRLIDGALYVRGEKIYMDVFSGKVRTSKVFDVERTNAATIRNWVNSNFVRMAGGNHSAKPRTAGGKGSGNFGHAGRPGNLGGSSAGTEHLETYVATGGAYSTINQKLRTSADLDDEEKNTVDALDRMIAQGSIDSDRVLYRTSDTESAFKDLQVGDEFSDPAFLSTSKNTERFHAFKDDPQVTRFKFNVKKGMPALDVNSMLPDHENSGDDEVLLPRGMKWRVVSRRGNLIQLEPKVESLGGKGSGDFGHAGRPGKKGGSAGTQSAADLGSSLKKSTNFYSGVFYFDREGAEATRQKLGLEASAVSKTRRGFMIRSPKGESFGPEGWVSKKEEISQRSEKAKLALKNHNPFTREKEAWATKNEGEIVAMIGGKGTDDNRPVDVVREVGGKQHGIEVKTMLDNKAGKITMRKDAVARKEKWARQNKAVLHTVIVDDRDKFGRKDLHSGHRVYYQRGIGSFRLATMTPVRDAAHLRELMQA
jgi:pterin-4a-carbinolamine dehydratase